jgi:transposase
MKDTRSLSADAQEAIRIRAVKAVEGGKTEQEAADLMGVTRQTVSGWWKLYKKGGIHALKAKKRGRPSAASKIMPRIAALVVHVILTSSPEKHGCTGVLWTRHTVAELIVAKGGPVLSRWTVGRLLKKWNMTPQKPAKRAMEQDPAAVRRWLKEEYPAIVAEAKTLGAEIHWEDETGLRSDHQAGTTYGRRGKTPVVEGTGQRWSVNMLSTLTNKGFLRFMMYSEKFTTTVFLDFLRRLIRDTDAMPFIIMDRHPVHYRSKKVRKWLVDHHDEIRAFWLPGYCPQLNPVELLNQDIKANAIGRKRPKSLKELKKNVRSHLRKKQRRPPEAKTYFLGASVRYAR